MTWSLDSSMDRDQAGMSRYLGGDKESGIEAMLRIMGYTGSTNDPNFDPNVTPGGQVIRNAGESLGIPVECIRSYTFGGPSYTYLVYAKGG